jgi:hypothetical protein
MVGQAEQRRQQMKLTTRLALAALAAAVSLSAHGQQQDPASTTQPRMEAARKALEQARGDL